MHGNPRNEMQQLGLDRNRGEERGGQQERDGGAGGGQQLGQEGQQERKLGKEDGYCQRILYFS